MEYGMRTSGNGRLYGEDIGSNGNMNILLSLWMIWKIYQLIYIGKMYGCGWVTLQKHIL